MGYNITAAFTLLAQLMGHWSGRKNNGLDIKWVIILVTVLIIPITGEIIVPPSQQATP